MTLAAGADVAVKRRARTPLWTGLLLLAALLLASALLVHRSGRPSDATFGDAPEYLDGAYHLFHEHTYSHSARSAPAPPEVGREPGYSALLAVLMAIDPALRQFRPECLDDPKAPCDPATFRSVSLANLLMIELAGAALFALIWRMTSDVWASLIGAAYIVLNLRMDRFWSAPMSDWLAVLLVSLLLLAVAAAWQGRGPARWALVGLVLAALSLTKAVFVFFCLAAAALVLVAAVCRKALGRRLVGPLVAASLVYAAIVGGWTARNWAVSGELRLSDTRGAVALSTREVFDHMSGAQYLAAFVYWTHGPGPALARRLFAPATVDPFDIDRPGGFYDRGQNGYLQRTEALAKETGMSWWQAAAAVEKQIVRSIQEHPLLHAATTLPLLYRGIWIDEFVLPGLPVFVWMTWRAVRRRDLLLAVLLSVGLFNHLFYAAFSLNIPRYQMTAMPSVALAVALAASLLRARTKARQRNDEARPHTAAPEAVGSRDRHLSPHM